MLGLPPLTLQAWRTQGSLCRKSGDFEQSPEAPATCTCQLVQVKGDRPEGLPRLELPRPLLTHTHEPPALPQPSPCQDMEHLPLSNDLSREQGAAQHHVLRNLLFPGMAQ